MSGQRRCDEATQREADCAAAAEDEENMDDHDAAADDVREPTAQEMTEEEMKAKGYFVVEQIVRGEYRHGQWRFLTAWRGFSVTEQTWEPVSAFVLGKDKLNAKFVDFCEKHGLPQPLNQAKRIARQRRT